VERGGPGPATVGVDQLTRLERERAGGGDVDERHRVALARSLAQSNESAAFVALEIDFGDRHLCADDGRSEREASEVFERLQERPQLLVRSVRIDRDRVDQRVDVVAHVRSLRPRQHC
jgi:hypothetical protein